MYLPKTAVGTDNKGGGGARSSQQQLRALQQPQLKLKRVNLRSYVVDHPFCSALASRPRHGVTNPTNPIRPTRKIPDSAKPDQCVGWAQTKISDHHKTRARHGTILFFPRNLKKPNSIRKMYMKNRVLPDPTRPNPITGRVGHRPILTQNWPDALLRSSIGPFFLPKTRFKPNPTQRKSDKVY